MHSRGENRKLSYGEEQHDKLRGRSHVSKFAGYETGYRLPLIKCKLWLRNRLSATEAVTIRSMIAVAHLATVKEYLIHSYT